MAEEFSRSVEDGLKLAKRLYFGKDRAVAASPPTHLAAMDKSGGGVHHLPTSPMAYAVVHDPSIVDNPDIPSYQPHVHGKCDSPALIPLPMSRVEIHVDTFLDTATVSLSAAWRVHCVMGSKSCDCQIAIPMGEQGSILGLEVEVPRKVYSIELTGSDDKKDSEKEVRLESGGFLKPDIFTLTIPKVYGGSNVSIKVSWVQKLLYSRGEFSLVVPFSFPDYVTPAVKKLPKKEKIQLNVNSGTGSEIVCKSTSHPFKELKREAGKLSFLYEAEVLSWRTADLAISYCVSSSHIFGGVLLQSPAVHDMDQRETFCFYLFPGDQKRMKIFRKEIVFVIDISGSMRGKPIEATKNAVSEALQSFDSKDSFNILAFNGETYLFSTSMELATEGNIDKAVQWMDMNFITGGSTNILKPLTEAIEMLSNAPGSVPTVFFVTDGSVEDERHICDVIKSHVTGGRSIHPRIYTFGIGSYCNHYFLRMLATISKGQHRAAYDIDSIGSEMQTLLRIAMFTTLANVSIDALDSLDEVELFPAYLPDLSSESPLIVSGRYRGKFPETLKARGISGDLKDLVVDLKFYRVKDLNLNKVLATQCIDQLTAHAWLSESKEIEDKVANMSLESGIVSEYTRMVLVENESMNQPSESPAVNKSPAKSSNKVLLPKMGVGFGNLTATSDNTRPGFEEPKMPEAAEVFLRAASGCCGKMWTRCCCMCCIQCCSSMNNQCAIVLTQCCTALAWFSCFECCSAICCPGSDGS